MSQLALQNFTLKWASSYNGSYSVEKTLAAWGLSRPVLHRVSQAVSTLTLTLTVKQFDAAPLFPYLSWIVLYYTDPKTSVKTIRFQGVVTSLPAQGSGPGETQQYIIGDSWWFLDELIYQQQWTLTLSGQGATFGTPTLSGDGMGKITGCTASGGTGYVTGQYVFFTDTANPALGSGAYGTVVANGAGALTGIIIVKQGLGYSSPAVGEPNDPYRSHCFLNPWIFISGSSLNNSYWARRSTGYQISDVVTTFLAYAASQSGQVFPLQLQSPLPADISFDIPTEEVRDITCAEVLRKQLRWMPDAVTWFDYTTSPPTLCFGRRQDFVSSGSLSNINLSSLKSLSSLSITPRYDLLRPVVVTNFEAVNTVSSNGGQQTWQTLTRVIAPAPSGSPPRPSGYEVGALVCTIELAGLDQTDITGSLYTQAVSAMPANTGAYSSASDPTLDTWWLGKQEWLAGVNSYAAGPIGPQILSLTFTDAQGNPTSTPPSATPYELLSGNIAPWMANGGTPIISQYVTITATIQYAQNNPASGDPSQGPYTGPLATQGVKTVSVKIRMTNCPLPGTPGQPVVFNTIGSFLTPEAIPTSLAESLYQSVGTLFYDGEITLQEQDCTGLVTTGSVINILGSQQSAWSTMSEIIQEITEDFEAGTTTVKFGPPGHLGAADLVELTRLTRLRINWVNPAAQSNPQQEQPQTDIGGSTAIENSNSHTSSYNAWGTSIPIPSSYGSGWPTNMGTALASGSAVTSTVPLPGSHVPATRGSSQLLGSSLALYREDVTPPVSANVTVPDAQKASATILAAIADLLGSDSNYHAVTFTEIGVCVGGTQKKMIVLGSQPY